MNLRRGSYIVAFVGAWVLTPWNILASASALLNFMDGYTIWVSFFLFSPETRKKKGVRKDEGRKTKTKTDPLNHHPAGTNHWYPFIRLLPRPPPKIPSSRTLRPSRSLSLQPPRNKLESNGSFCRKLDSSHARFCTCGKYTKTKQTTLTHLFFFDFLS